MIQHTVDIVPLSYVFRHNWSISCGGQGNTPEQSSEEIYLIIVLIVAGGVAFAFFKKFPSQNSQNSSESAQNQSEKGKNLPAVAVELIATPDPIAIGKKYAIDWRAGKDIASVEIDLGSADSNGDQLYLEKSVHEQGTFQWNVLPSFPEGRPLLEGQYVFTIIGKTADYDATAKKLDDIYKKKNPTRADLQEADNLRKKLEKMIATSQSNSFSILEKELPKISSDSLSNVSSIDGFQIRYEFQALPSSIAVGTNLKFIYKKHSAMVRSCVINKDEQKNVFWCYIPWSSLLSDYSKKGNWAIFIDNSTQGTAAERDQKRMKDMQQLATAVQNYKVKNGTYPCSNGRCGDQSSIYGQSNVVFPNFQGVHYEDPLGEKDKNFEYIYGSDVNGYQVYAQLENSFKDGDADFYCIDSLGAKGIISERPLSLSCESKLRPGETFNRAYRCDYLTDATSAYHDDFGKLVKLPGSDPATFRNVQNKNSCIALDKNHIYFIDQVILPEADPATFEVLGNGNYARDKNHVYRIYPMPITTLENTDPKTFSPPQ